MQECESRMTIFNQQEYIKILMKLKSTHEFIGLNQISLKKKFCLLRHDIDFSINRALAVAQAEAKINIRSTYYLNPHSEFYNLHEKNQAQKIEKILELGHDIGLHFDPAFYGRIDNQFERHLFHEKSQLEYLFRCKITSFSFHNTTDAILRFDDHSYAGMVNCYSQKLRTLPYCSDSTGIWRYDNLIDFIEKHKDQNLHILTHPGWWLQTDMLPRSKIYRACIGRAQFQLRFYDEYFQNHNSSSKYYGQFLAILEELEDSQLLSHCDYLYHQGLSSELYVLLLRTLYELNPEKAKNLESSFLLLDIWSTEQKGDVDLYKMCVALAKEISDNRST